MSKLSIMIPVFNQSKFTDSALKDLSNLKHEVIVVDNGSTDDTKDVVAKYDVTYFNLGKNTGFAHAVNYGYSKSFSDYVMFLNNDIKVTKEHDSWPDRILNACKGNTLVSPTMGILDSNFNFIRETNDLTVLKPDHKYYMSGWNLTGRRKDLDKMIINDYVGPFTEEFTTYFEDTDLSFRAVSKGWKLKMVPVPVVHYGSVTSKKVGISELYSSAKVKFIKKWEKKSKLKFNVNFDSIERI